MTSTDNILIAVILGTVVVGQYSNYLLIITAINGLIMLVAQSVIASLGNFNVTESPARKLMIFRCMLLFFCAVATFCSCCFLSMFNDFISIWIGKVDPDYVLSDYSVYAITFNFFINCVLTPIWMFRESTGLFNQVKYSMMFAAIINIILSIILGNIMGLSGIVAATAISKLLTNFWYEPKILFREVFQLNTKAYWKFILRLLLIALPCLAICVIIGKALPGTIPYIILKIFISGIVTLVAFCLINYRTEEFSYLYNAFLAVINRKRRKNVT
jgi:O-antigen/teichoic acid export membrane protein